MRRVSGGLLKTWQTINAKNNVISLNSFRKADVVDVNSNIIPFAPVASMGLAAAM